MKPEKLKHHNYDENKVKESIKKGKLELVVDNTITAGWSCSLCDCPRFEYTDDAQFCDFCEHTRDAHNPSRR